MSLSDYFLNIDIRGDERATEDMARENWDENTPLDDAIEAGTAYEILDLLLCDPEKARKRLETELDLEYARYLERCKEAAAEAEYDAICY